MNRNKKGQFVKGNISIFKGTKGILKANNTSFKKGIIPWSKGKKLKKIGEKKDNQKKCIREGNPCEIHSRKGYEHHKCGIRKKRVKKIYSQEERDRMSNWAKEHNHKPPSRLGTVPWNKGLKGWRAGEKSHLWKGGKSTLKDKIRGSFESRQYRSDIFHRDNFTCQKCGLRGGFIEIHHIKPFSVIFNEYKISSVEDSINCSELWDLNNGITLCKKCHSETDTYAYKAKFYKKNE